MTEKKTDIVKIILAVLAMAMAAFGVVSYVKSTEEHKKKIEAQNEIARLSVVIEEKDGSWSRLSQQSEEIISSLESKNRDLADIVRERSETILSLNETIANFSPTKIVVRRTNVTEVTTGAGEEERVTVSFAENVDPVRVEGFTITNPPEAEVTVSFTRPLRLHTAITQQEDGSWRTYVSGDWPNLQIENIETVVNPRLTRPRGFFDRLSLVTAVAASTKFDSFFVGANILYDVNESFSFGPMIGASVVEDRSSAVLGLSVQWHMF